MTWFLENPSGNPMDHAELTPVKTQHDPVNDYSKHSSLGLMDPIEREVEVMTVSIDDFAEATDDETTAVIAAIESRQLSRVEHNVELSMIWLVKNGD